jgi:hypothetical protein
MKEQTTNAYEFMKDLGLKDCHFYILGKFTGQVIDKRYMYIEKRKIYFFEFTKECISYNKDDNSVYINNAYTMNDESRHIENSKVGINNNLYTRRKGKDILNYRFEEISAEDFSNLKNGKPKTRKMFYIG